MLYSIAKLTDYEVEALPNVFNFADGHARYTVTQDEAQIWEKLPGLLPHKFAQDDLGAEFNETFFDFANQGETMNREFILHCPSASVSIEIVANYLRIENLSVALIEPTFDNLADILKRHWVIMDSVKEDYLRNFGIRDWLKNVKTDAIFVVIPNNPTGYVFSEADFHYLVEFCVRETKLLILDFSFRFFSRELLQWDQYAFLAKSGVQYITIEDTGKTWPTFELKVGLLLADALTYQKLCSIYRDIFLCLSPIVLVFVSEYIKTSKKRGIEESILSIPKANRELLHQVISNTPLRPMSYSSTSVEWLRIEAELDDLEITERLKKYGIYVLPGRNFFWSDHRLGSDFIRVALMRDIEVFAKGMKRLQEVLPQVLASC